MRWCRHAFAEPRSEPACPLPRLAPVPTPLRARLAAALAFVVLTAVAPGCTVAPGPSLADRQFLSVAVTEDGAPKALVAGTRIRLNFGSEELGASAGCNSIGGTFRVESGRLVFAGGDMTAMGCDQARHDQDDWLVAFLASQPALSLAGNELTLHSTTIAVRLMDREVVEPDAALAGPTWTVTSIISGDAVSSVPPDAVATLVFRADGSLEVNAGCNRGGGLWQAVAGGIELGPLLLTKMACAGAGAALEGAVLSVLEAGTVTAGIEASILTIRAGPNGLQLSAS